MFNPSIILLIVFATLICGPMSTSYAPELHAKFFHARYDLLNPWIHLRGSKQKPKNMIQKQKIKVQKNIIDAYLTLE